MPHIGWRKAVPDPRLHRSAHGPGGNNFANTAAVRIPQMLIYALLLVGSSHATATVTQLTEARCPQMDCWEITGNISDADQRQVVAMAGRLAGSKREKLFWLNSEGGDVEAAIAIGRQLRRMGAVALVLNEARCLSSCVFVLAGAARRGLYGQIGIHRPYALRTDQRPYDTVQQDQRRLAKLAKEYLEEMNVSPSLYDAMVRVPPEKVRLLSPTELEQFGITKTDPVWEEVVDANLARTYGLSKTEYLRRKGRVDIVCARELRHLQTGGDGQSYVNCRDRIFGTPK